MQEKIAKRLEQLRIDHNLSQTQLASLLNVTEIDIDDWEKAKGSPGASVLVELAKIYQISVDELLYVDDCIPEYDEEAAMNRDSSAIREFTQDPYFNANSQLKSSENDKGHLNRAIWRFPCLVLVIIAFLCCGFIANAWHPAWLLFLLIPIYETLLDAVDKKDPNRFGIPIVAVLIFLMFGLFADAWHPGWTVFLIVPLYYGTIAWIRAIGRGVDSAVADYIEDEKK